MPSISASFADDEAALASALARGLQANVVIFSGGTSKGAGRHLVPHRRAGCSNPGIVAHGVALKPGKPICLAVTDGKPVVILPGFPDVGDLHVPRVRRAGDPRVCRPAGGAAAQRRAHAADARQLRARTHRVPARRPRAGDRMASTAYPMGKGSGSVTTFSGADGFITIDQHTEILDADSAVRCSCSGATSSPPTS